MLKSVPLSSVLFVYVVTFASSLNEEGTNLLKLTTLLSFTDPTWSARDPTPCAWDGVTCDTLTGSVTGLDLSNSGAAGVFPVGVLSTLKNLSFLSFFNASLNSSLPVEISACKSLTYLDLSQNYLTGDIPATLADLHFLKHLDLFGNNFSGKIPDEFGRFRSLEVLSLVANLLTGVIPPSLGNISTLKQLNLSFNTFSPGNIPAELGNLRNLEILWLTECSLVGEIPDSLGRLAKLKDLDLASNRLIGGIPESLSGLTNVSQIELYDNSLSGEIPSVLGKLTALRLFDASTNRLTGPIPEELTRLPLSSLSLYENMLDGNVHASIASSPNLFELRLFNNFFTGELPRDLGSNSPLTYLEVSHNQLSGEIPHRLCEKGKLSELILLNNSFTGSIPDRLKNCASLTRVRMSDNRLAGAVPEGLWGLPNLELLDLAGNELSGGISKNIGRARELSSLTLDGNFMNGSIPEEIGDLVSLEKFSASHNQFSGKLPASLVHLSGLGSLDLHGNQLSGELPVDMNGWSSMNALNLANNRFSGSIPKSIGNFSVLTYLDLSNNFLTGKIPASLGNLKLNQLNLSNNKLSGPIPFLYANDVYRFSFTGNPALCRYMKNLCNEQETRKGEFYVWLLRMVFALSAAVLVGGLVWFHVRLRRQKQKSSRNSKWTLMSFHKMDFKEEEILNSLDEDSVVGCGSSGKVYKVVLSSGETVAVKKFWKEKSRENEFSTEVKTLGEIRHKRIVKLWCSCSTAEHKVLVYEFMSNGSLGDLLHSSKGGLLEWENRFRILLDAAEGLSYLHHDCSPPIIHRDVKANNILLDGEFRAKLADFGVARVYEERGKKETMSIIAGSCGYIAPEYSYTLRVNEKSDIYSFGVVILEVVTGRLPVDVEYGERDLVKWVTGVIEQEGKDHVIDAKLSKMYREEICAVLRVGQLCTSHLPINRPPMRTVVKVLKEIWAANHDKDSYVDGKRLHSFNS